MMRYSLAHTSPGPVNTPKTSAQLILKLERLFNGWRQQLDSVPSCFAYILSQNCCLSKDFSANDLVGPDAVLFNQLKQTCNSDDFYLCFATLRAILKDKDAYDSDIAGDDLYHRNRYREEYRTMTNEIFLVLKDFSDGESHGLFRSLKTNFSENSLLQPDYFYENTADSSHVEKGGTWTNRTIHDFHRKVCEYLILSFSGIDGPSGGGDRATTI